MPAIGGHGDQVGSFGRFQDGFDHGALHQLGIQRLARFVQYPWLGVSNMKRLDLRCERFEQNIQGVQSPAGCGIARKRHNEILKSQCTRLLIDKRPGIGRKKQCWKVGLTGDVLRHRP